MPKTSEVYEKLYHYTNWDGLQGILQSQSLWATHYKFLNDYSEIILFRDKLISLIYPYVRQAYEKLIQQSPNIAKKINNVGGLNNAVQHDTEIVVNAQYRATGEQFYIVSFCGGHENPNINRNGLLSQWRGYGAGGGFALVFDTKKIEELLQLEAEKYQYDLGHISDLIYSDDEEKLKEELSDDLTILADDVKQLFNPDCLGKKEEIGELKGYIPFVKCISRYKHYGFKEENEVRIVALPTVFNQNLLNLADLDKVKLKPEKEIKFRKSNGHQIPYIDLFDTIDIGLPIEKIIVGPHNEKERRASALRAMLRKTNIEILCSDIPYVGQ